MLVMTPESPDSNRARLATILVNWNGGELTAQCLSHLEGHPCGRVIVVDNGSKDGSREASAAWLAAHDGLLIENDDNLGFAVAANQGMRAALEHGAEFVFLLNNDARLRPGAMETLLAAAEREPTAGLLAGKILDGTGDRIWCAGVDVGFHANLQRLRGFNEPDRGAFDQEENVDALTGCGLLIRRAVLEQVGDFDESLFVYVEDIELCLRARDAGWTCRYVPTSVMTHEASSATGGGYNAWRKYMVAYNLVLFVKKRRKLGLWLQWLVVELAAWPAAWLLALRKGRGAAAQAKRQGMLHGLFGRPAQPPSLS